VFDQILAERYQGRGSIALIAMNPDSFASIRRAAEKFLESSGGRLNTIITNGDIMAWPYNLTTSGHETQFATNHIGDFLLFPRLEDALLASATKEYLSRYVSVVSMAHTFSPVHLSDRHFAVREYKPWAATCGQFKTANIWIANHVERLYVKEDSHPTSVHYSEVVEGSKLSCYLPRELFEAMLSNKATKRTFKSVQQRAAIGEEWENKGGRYLVSLAKESR
jgi:NAD(P)-dependent dehydrogenase (short-subunit alcohol dehydrogenase family)